MRRCVIGVAGLLALAAGCGRTPANAAAAQVAPAKKAAAQESYPWLTHAPLKETMRQMWVDCGVILSVAAPGGTQIDHERVECAAEDIARKAQRMAGLWQACLDSLEGCADEARQGDWDAAWQHHGRLWKRCCDCHVDTWAPIRRGVSPGSIDGWREGKAAKLIELPKGALQTPEGGPAVTVHAFIYCSRLPEEFPVRRQRLCPFPRWCRIS